MSNRTKNPHEQGIAVIVVVAIMVALIMVTTALLATVRQSTATARIYMQRDLARLGALSARGAAVKNILAVIATPETTIEKINNAPSSATLLGTQEFTATTIEDTAYGLVPYAKSGIYGRTYGKQCPVRPPLSAILRGLHHLYFQYDSASFEYKEDDYFNPATGAIIEGGSSSVDSAHTILFDTIASFWQAPYSYTTVPVYTKLFPQLISLCGYDKDMEYQASGDYFYEIKYAASIQDLGGTICIQRDPNGDSTVNNNFDNSITAKLIKNIDGEDIAGGATFFDSAFTNFEDIANRMSIYNDGKLLTRLNLSPWGKEDANGIPLCINIYTASEAVIRSCVKLIIEDNKIKVYRAANGAAVPPVTELIGASIGSLSADADQEKIVQRILQYRIDSAGGNYTISKIADKIVSEFSGDDDKKKAAGLLILALFGRYYDLDYDNDGATTDAAVHAAMISCSTDGSTWSVIDKTKLLAFKYPRLIGFGSDDATLPAPSAPVSATTIGAGPYFRIFCRGVLLNLGKSSIVSSADYECVYDAVNKKIVYQRWFENE